MKLRFIIGLLLLTPIAFSIPAAAQDTGTALGVDWTRILVPDTATSLVRGIEIGDAPAVIYTEDSSNRDLVFAIRSGGTYNITKVVDQTTGTLDISPAGLRWLGGEKWIIVYQHGGAIGGAVNQAYTTNNGVNWTITEVLADASAPPNIFTADSGTFTIYSESEYVITTRTRVFHTVDIGVTWTVLTTCEYQPTDVLYYGQIDPSGNVRTYGANFGGATWTVGSTLEDSSCSVYVDIDTGTPGTQSECLLDLPEGIIQGTAVAIIGDEILFGFRNTATATTNIYFLDKDEWALPGCTTTPAEPAILGIGEVTISTGVLNPATNSGPLHGAFLYQLAGTRYLYSIVGGIQAYGSISGLTGTANTYPGVSTSEIFLAYSISGNTFVWQSDTLPDGDDVSGGIGTAPLPPGVTPSPSPIQNMKNFFETSWGFTVEQGNWLFAVGIIILLLYAVIRWTDNILVVGIMGLLGIGICIALGFLEEWFLFIVVFLIIAVAGGVIFGSSSSGDDGS